MSTAERAWAQLLPVGVALGVWLLLCSHNPLGTSRLGALLLLMSPALQDSRGEARRALLAPCHGVQAGQEVGLLIVPLSCSLSSLQEGATLLHTAVLGNQVIPHVGRRHLPLPVSTACGLCSPLPLVLRARDVFIQLSSRERRVQGFLRLWLQLPPP